MTATVPCLTWFARVRVVEQFRHTTNSLRTGRSKQTHCGPNGVCDSFCSCAGVRPFGQSFHFSDCSGSGPILFGLDVQKAVVVSENSNDGYGRLSAWDPYLHC